MLCSFQGARHGYLKRSSAFGVAIGEALLMAMRLGSRPSRVTRRLALFLPVLPPVLVARRDPTPDRNLCPRSKTSPMSPVRTPRLPTEHSESDFERVAFASEHSESDFRPVVSRWEHSECDFRYVAFGWEHSESDFRPVAFPSEISECDV
jgi:hypothetical protein